MSAHVSSVKIDDEKIRDLAYQSTVLDKYVQLGREDMQASADSKVAIEALDAVDLLYANVLALQMNAEKQYEDDPMAVIRAEVAADGDAKTIALLARFDALLATVDQQHTKLLATIWKPGLLEIREKYLPLP